MGNRKRQPIKQIRMNKKGETLVETIVSFVIVIIALAAITALISSATTMNRKAQEKSDAIETAATKVEQNAGADQGDGALTLTIGGKPVEMAIKVKDADLFTYFSYVPGKSEPDPGGDPDDQPDPDEIIKAKDWPDPDKMGEQELFEFGTIVKYNQDYYVVTVTTYVYRHQAAAGPSKHPNFKMLTGTVLTDKNLNASGFFDKVEPGDLYRDADGKLYVYAHDPGGWAYPPSKDNVYWQPAS